MPSPDFPPRLSVPSYGKAVAFNADGSRLYVVAEGVLIGFSRGGKPRIAFEAVEDHRPQALAVSPTGATVACTTDAGIVLYDAGGKRLRVTAMTEGVDVAHA